MEEDRKPVFKMSQKDLDFLRKGIVMIQRHVHQDRKSCGEGSDCPEGCEPSHELDHTTALLWEISWRFDDIVYGVVNYNAEFDYPMDLEDAYANAEQFIETMDRVVIKIVMMDAVLKRHNQTGKREQILNVIRKRLYTVYEFRDNFKGNFRPLKAIYDKVVLDREVDLEIARREAAAKLELKEILLLGPVEDCDGCSTDKKYCSDCSHTLPNRFTNKKEGDE